MTTTSSTAGASRLGQTRVGVQRFGSFLSNMILPNIAAFIAWGIITALFIADGPFPNEDFASLVVPILFVLIPVLIAFTGGRMVYDWRGGVVGAVTAMGVIAAEPERVMILGAMIAGPLAAWLFKQLERLWKGKVRAGFEMLVDNFSAGIFAFITALLAFVFLSKFVVFISDVFGGAVGFLVDRGLLPLASIIVEPAKVLFLNNAINHGVFTPLGAEQAAETGRASSS
jgi:PTS system mannitol-specific IIC component